VPEQRIPLPRRLEALRHVYTGETASALKPAIKAGLAPLDKQDREALTRILNANEGRHPIRNKSFPATDGWLRDAVLNDAADRPQQELDAAVLLALGNLAPFRQARGSVAGPQQVCLRVHSVVDDARVAVAMRPAMIAPTIAALAPRLVDQQLMGVAGLRWRPHRRHVELYLADASDITSLALAGTDWRDWRAIRAFVEVVTGRSWPDHFDAPLTDTEREAVAAGRVQGPVFLLSALLRRLRVLGDTDWLRIRCDGLHAVRVDWAGHDRTTVEAAEALMHPLVGLPGDRVLHTPDDHGAIAITVTENASAEPARLTLHHVGPTTPPDAPTVDVNAAWTRYFRNLNAPTAKKPPPAPRPTEHEDRAVPGSGSDNTERIPAP
jgi:hypothetical protein